MPEGTDDDIDGSDTDSIFDEDDDVMMPLSIRMDNDVIKLKTNNLNIVLYVNSKELQCYIRTYELRIRNSK